ncbi:polysaccharide pyruvyl transferase family protein [Demequina aurantiaca]|uniref:polysaccharide pyruvyl transferase family protein n=1 Tax=Demequina aurantiaca TaxID=676200 RepID=UPI003D3258DB
MNVVVIGDIGWQYLYHLGDEAMTEAAIDQLRERGITNITLVAGQPEVAEQFYGLPSVARAGFNTKWSRDGNEGHLRVMEELLESGDFEEGGIHAAIRDCDAVLIAGGGNLNSTHFHHLYERLAAKRMAEFFGKRLYVTSQTVGPVLTPVDREKVAEIADYAECFGAREESTYKLMTSLAQRPERVFHTMDDAVMLRSDAKSVAAVEAMGLPDRYILASFSNGHGTAFKNAHSYYRAMAKLIDQLAVRNDIDVLLAPHAGSFDPARTTRDQDSDLAIAGYSTSGRVRNLGLITAREDVALIERAALSLSTRYHAAVFAPAATTPTAAIAPSYYSSIRMRGALRNVGAERFVVPAVSMHLAVDAFSELLEQDEAIRAHLAGTQRVTVGYQSTWWDAMTQSMLGGEWRDPGHLPRVETYVPVGEWSAQNEKVIPIFDQFTQEIEALRGDNAALRDQLMTEERINIKSEALLARAHDNVERYRSRKVVRLANMGSQMGRKLTGASRPEPDC